MSKIADIVLRRRKTHRKKLQRCTNESEKDRLSSTRNIERGCKEDLAREERAQRRQRRRRRANRRRRRVKVDVSRHLH